MQEPKQIFIDVEQTQLLLQIISLRYSFLTSGEDILESNTFIRDVEFSDAFEMAGFFGVHEDGNQLPGLFGINIGDGGSEKKRLTRPIFCRTCSHICGDADA